jgi:hypothetical protein
MTSIPFDLSLSRTYWKRNNLTFGYEDRWASEKV